MGDARRVWAVSAVHGEARRLSRVHDLIGERFSQGDRLVYLGNYLGHGEDIAEAQTGDEREWVAASAQGRLGGSRDGLRVSTGADVGHAY